MALVNCKHCGKEVSDKAKVCPGCGGNLVDEIAVQEDATQDVVQAEEIKQLLCEECGAEILEGSEACPKCGCPVKQEDNAEPAAEADTPTVPVKKKKHTGKVIAIIAAIVVLVGLVVGYLFYSGTILLGDDKIAYDYIVEVADQFKDSSSVRLESGQVINMDDYNFDMGGAMKCILSANNSFGSRISHHYAITELSGNVSALNVDGYLTDTEGYTDTESLHINQINKKLARTLGYGD